MLSKKYVVINCYSLEINEHMCGGKNTLTIHSSIIFGLPDEIYNVHQYKQAIDITLVAHLVNHPKSEHKLFVCSIDESITERFIIHIGPYTASFSEDIVVKSLFRC